MGLKDREREQVGGNVGRWTERRLKGKRKKRDQHYRSQREQSTPVIYKGHQQKH